MKPCVWAGGQESVTTRMKHPPQQAVDVGPAGFGLEHLKRDPPGHEVTEGVLVCHDRGNRTLLGKQRRVPKAFALTKYVKDDVFDPNLDSALPDHIQHVRWVRIAAKDRRPFGEVGPL
jgi:hypothetical protein